MSGPGDATLRLADGERLFYPGVEQVNDLSLYSYMRRVHGLYFHSRKTAVNGESGILVWADDQPRLTRRGTPRRVNRYVGSA